MSRGCGASSLGSSCRQPAAVLAHLQRTYTPADGHPGAPRRQPGRGGGPHPADRRRAGHAHRRRHAADDADCLHVRRADERGPAARRRPGRLSRRERSSRAAVAAGADAVHPGYGFLAENAGLRPPVRRGRAAFVGPAADALALFGDKSRGPRARPAGSASRCCAATAGPADRRRGGGLPAGARAGGARHGQGASPAAAAAACARSRDPDDLAGGAASAAARRRAAAFGDGDLYVERLLPRARHVEVQLVGDGAGAVACLRRPRLQPPAPPPEAGRDRARRPASPPALRAALHAAAVAPGARRSAYAAWPPSSSWSRGDGGTPSWRSIRGCRWSTRSPRRSPGSTWSRSRCAIAGGATLDDLGLGAAPRRRGSAVQARVNAETLRPDGTVRPAAGALTRFAPPTGRGVRVDTPRLRRLRGQPALRLAAGQGGRPRRRAATCAVPRAAARRALAEFDVAGPTTNLGAARARCSRAPGGRGRRGVDTDVRRRAPRRAAAGRGPRARGGGRAAVRRRASGPAIAAPLQGVVVEVLATRATASPPAPLSSVLEAMKMEHVVAGAGGRGAARAAVARRRRRAAGHAARLRRARRGRRRRPRRDAAAVDLDAHPPRPRRGARAAPRSGLDEARPEAVGAAARGRPAHRPGERRRARATRARSSSTARSVIAAQRAPADARGADRAHPGRRHGRRRRRGSTARPCAVLVLRLHGPGRHPGLSTTARPTGCSSWPSSGGCRWCCSPRAVAGGRATPTRPGVSRLDCPTFTPIARLAGRVPTVGVVSGHCFAGNAALVGVCDVIIATEDASIGMGGPAMIEGGGLGVVAPEEIGPIDGAGRQRRRRPASSADDAAAVAAARRYLSYFPGPDAEWEAPTSALLRTLVPENRRAQLRRAAGRWTTLADAGSVLELRRAVRRRDRHRAGPDRGPPGRRPRQRPAPPRRRDRRRRRRQGRRASCGCATRAGCRCVSLVDTPGFMVGPEAERTGTVRRFGAAVRRRRQPHRAAVRRRAAQGLRAGRAWP